VTIKPLILTVDRNRRNLELLGQCLADQGCEVYPVSALDCFDPIVEQAARFRLALVDISGFDRRVWRFCNQITDQGVPLYIISPHHVSWVKHESLTHGARGVLFKPLPVHEFSNLVQTIVRHPSNE
jgi:DNA-binding response OmpR family regulator